ncbi:MAG: hypothetical protein RIC55_33535 [Pirellulaceae bacterium]
MRLPFALTLLCFPVLLGCGAGDDASGGDAAARPDATLDQAANDASTFHDLRPGQWQLLTGTVVKTAEPVPRTRSIAYRFEVGRVARPTSREAPAGVAQIQWSNDDENPESGEFLVPLTGLNSAELVHAMIGPLGEGGVVKELSEQYTIGDRTFACRRLDRLSQSEFGAHSSTVWLSREAPVARIVAYHSSWRPAPEWSASAPATELTIELAAYGDQQDEIWSRGS